MNAQTIDIILETTRAALLAVILLLLVIVGRRRIELSQRGWWLIVSGFALVLCGNVLDITDNCDQLSRFVVIGDTPVQAFFEKVVGFVGGFSLIAAGLYFWIPNITSIVELQESERTNQALLDAFPDLIMRIGKGGVYQWVHVPKEFAPIWGTKNPVGRTVTEMLPPVIAERALACHEGALATGRNHEYEYVATTDGLTNYREARVVPLRADCVLVIARDITVRKQTEQMLQRYTEELELARTRLEKQAIELQRQAEELRVARAHAEQSSHAKSEFLAHMSHEIRTPMTSILGYADILMEDVSQSEALNAAQTIRRNGEYLLTIINDILDLSKIEAGKLTIDKTDVNPSELVADVAALMRVRAEAKGLPLEIEFDGPTPDQIVTDSIRLRQILINLMGNAIKFTEIGSVRLVTRLRRASKQEPRLEFAVIDTGRGIPEDQLGRLFRPFVQADVHVGHLVRGTGLGLAISKRLAEMMGGSISVRSTEGKGSTFTVAVPTGPLDGRRLIQRPAQTVQRRSVSELQSPNRPSLDCRILLAEDGPDNQRLISFVLRRAGAHVQIAEDGQQAVDILLGAHCGRRHHDTVEPFDVVLMDLQMPVMDGYAATRKLRENGYRGTIIALTAHAMPSERQRCLDAGCDDFATKPIDREQLFSLIRKYLGQPESADESVLIGPQDSTLRH